MVIIEGPYVSDHFCEYLEEKQIPVLDNAYAEAQCKKVALHLINDHEMVSRYQEDPKLYLSSENALDWVYTHLSDQPIVKKLEGVKNKVRFRELLRQLYPDFFFESVPFEKLKTYDATRLAFPVVLKPAVGFFSLGVYVIQSVAAWQHDVNEITAQITAYQTKFPESVVNLGDFIIEGYIKGTEYAVDAYYDREGKPVILNIFTHRFASEEDVSDRIYYTSKEMIEAYEKPFSDFLVQLNESLQLTLFPMHVELRVAGDRIIPIEVNPMRFAGLSCTDIAYYAYGINTVDYFLNEKVPDFKQLLQGKEDKLYSMIVLDKKEPHLPCSQFQYEKLIHDFQHVLMLRKVDTPALDIFGFLFVETEKGQEEELDRILHSDLMQYMG